MHCVILSIHCIWFSFPLSRAKKQMEEMDGRQLLSLQQFVLFFVFFFGDVVSSFRVDVGALCLWYCELWSLNLKELEV